MLKCAPGTYGGKDSDQIACMGAVWSESSPPTSGLLNTAEYVDLCSKVLTRVYDLAGWSGYILFTNSPKTTHRLTIYRYDYFYSSKTRDIFIVWNKYTDET